jgi:SAM-dependent methyltransferase
VADGERGAEYWNAVIRDRAAGRPGSTWRAHADRVNADFCRAFWPPVAPGRVLKTDLFDEASGTGLLPALAGGSGATYGIDRAEETTGISRTRHPTLRVAVADVRALPFGPGVFDLIVSNSTLDHFEHAADIDRSLRELARVLRPGGRLILTLDNPSNPIVALRNCLPFSWLNRVRLVPYYVGQTCGADEGRRRLEAAGFRPVAGGAVLHCPRVLAIVLASLLDRLPWAWPGRVLLAVLQGFEHLGRWPTRYLTGYYAGFVADRNHGDRVGTL